MDKTCPKCKTLKLSTDFGINRSRYDGLQSVCKICKKSYYQANKEQTIARAKRWREENREEYNQWRCNHRKGKGASKFKQNLERYKSKHPEKVKAKYLVKNAIRNGVLVKPTCCTICNKSFPKSKIHGHHENYDEPLEVIWACYICHSKIHNDYYAYEARLKRLGKG